MTIKINKTDITIRPSSIDTALQCGYQWGKVFLEGIVTIPNSRAAIGTGIHKGIEIMWNEAIKDNKKDPHVDAMFDAGIEAFKEESKKGLSYDNNENENTCHGEIVSGIQAYVDDAVPFLDIPEAVETRFTIPLKHPLVKDVSGTVDYYGGGNLDDVKSSKRTPTTANYLIQQSTYKLLAEANGKKVERNRIQGVVLTAKPKAVILDLVPDVSRAKWAINNLLDTLDCAVKGVAPMEVLFKPNPKYYLCSPKYCSLYGSCPATKKVGGA